MMNLSETITNIKLDLGIYGISLPFENPDKVIAETIKMRTIKTFSQYMPWIVTIDVDLNQLECIKSHFNESIYVLPDIFGDKRIVLIRNIYAKSKLIGNGYMNPVFSGSLSTYSALMMGQANADLLSTFVPPFTFKFEEPNIVYLYNMTTMAHQLTMEIGIEHDENLSTIKNTSWESFYSLALLDVKKLMYNALKHYNEIQTAYGTINLRIDDWSNAESERKDLLEKWDESYHIEHNQFFII